MQQAKAPGEFRYATNVGKPWARAFRLAAKTLLGFDPAPADDVVATIAAQYFDADPLAEAFVEEVYFGRGAAAGRALLDRAIAEGVDAIPDAPASLRALFADIDHDPA